MRPNPLIEKVWWADHVFGASALYRKARDFYWKYHFGLLRENRRGINEGAIENDGLVVDNFDTGLEQYRFNIRAAVDLIKLIGALPILAIEERFVAAQNTEEDKKLIAYHQVNVTSHHNLVEIFSACDRILRDISSDSNVPLFDVNRKVGGQREYFTDHVHTTPTGSAAIAHSYVDLLRPIVARIERRTRQGMTEDLDH